MVTEKSSKKKDKVSEKEQADAKIVRLVYDTIVKGKYKTVEEILTAVNKTGANVSLYKLRSAMDQLELSKQTNEKGERYYVAVDEIISQQLAQANLGSLIVNVEHNDMAVVVKTIPAAGPIIAEVLDSQSEMLEILGTIAGDDTILVLGKIGRNLDALVVNIIELFNTNGSLLHLKELVLHNKHKNLQKN